MIHENKIKAGIGKVVLQTKVDNSFPLVGETVTLQTQTKWSQNMTFELSGKTGQAEQEERPNASQQESVQIQIEGAGDLMQKITAENTLSSAVVNQAIMAMENQELPYFDVLADKEVARTDEAIQLYVVPENGYSFSRGCTVEIRIYRENTETDPIQVLSSDDSHTDATGRINAGTVIIPQRGIYDIHASVRDTNTDVTLHKQLNKLVTITPRLAARPTQAQIENKEYTEIVADKSKNVSLKMYETGENDLYCLFELREGQKDNGFYTNLDISKIPAGKDAYTFVIKADEEKEKYHSRILLTGATDTSKSNANGTPQFCYDVPLVFTIDQDTPLTIWGVYYNTVNYAGCICNTVWDGRGYYNLKKGMKFDRYSEDIYWEDAFMLLNGTSDVELFEIEICNTGFTAIASKTDPSDYNPWFWYGNFEEKNFVWHHSHIHDTTGEGYYLGYFTGAQSQTVYKGETVTFRNLAGENVTYTNGSTYFKRAHSLEAVRIYRNTFERLGYDGMQLSNARHSEVCYNTIDYGAIKNDANQASGISLQSMDGRIYNNVVTHFNGPGMQLGPMTDLEIFNNLINTDNRAADAIQFLFELENPDMNPSNGSSGVLNETTRILVHNNVLVAGRYSANGRNTVQMRNVHFVDNLMVNSGQNFANMTEETLKVWNNQMQGNAVYKLDTFKTILQELKIADRDNSDFRIGFDSPLAKQGVGTYFTFDFRGYRNWYPNVHTAGAYMGIYKNPDFFVEALQLDAVKVNEDVSVVLDRTVTVNIIYKGVPTRYRISELQDFSDTQWMPFTSAQIPFIISREYGEKTIYVQLSNISELSGVVNKTVEYQYVPTVLLGISINNGDTSTLFNKVKVKMDYSVDRPEQYLISERDDFEGSSWQDFDDVVDYFIEGDSGTVKLYVKVRKEEYESETKQASIDYTSTVTYKNITLRIPLAEIKGDSRNIRAVIPELKYNKRFAFAWTVDDTLIYVYSRMFNYIHKKWVDNTRIFHDGMPRTTGIMPNRYLCYTDGCGRDVRFGLNSGFISHLNGKTPVLDYTFTGSQYFHLGEMQKFIDFGNGLQNHGAGGYNELGAEEAVRICNEEVKAKLGFTPFLLLFPGEEDANAFKAAGQANPDIYQMSTLIKTESIAIGNPTDDFFRNKQSLMNRFTYDTYSLEQLKQKADYAYNQNNGHLMNMGGHNVTSGDSKFIDWDISVKPFLDYLYDTYGKGGNDSIWFAPLEEIYEYIFMRHFSTITVSNNATDLIISLKLAGMKNFRQGDISLKLSGSDLSDVQTLASENTLYYVGKGLQADGSLLIHLNDNVNQDLLAEKYVAAFETTPSQETLEDASYMIQALSENRRVPYQNRIDILNQPFGLKSIAINQGAGETTKPGVAIRIEYNGFVSPVAYRLGEDEDLSAAEWVDFVQEAPFTLSSGLGKKTVYCQIKANDGTLSEVKSDEIDLVEAGKRKTIVSLGWNLSEIPSASEGYYDPGTGISRFQNQSSIAIRRNVYDVTGDLLGTAVPSVNTISMLTQTGIEGTVTGDDTGIYPDIYLRHNASYGSNKEGSVNISFTLPPATYQVSILANTSWSTRPILNTALSYKVITATNEAGISLPETGVQNNTSQMSDPVEVTVGEDGLLKVEFGMNGSTSTYYVAPLNLIKIEEI